VVTARNGTTIERTNTDAEGRLILADSLGLAAEDHPDAILDLGTPTGSEESLPQQPRAARATHAVATVQAKPSPTGRCRSKSAVCCDGEVELQPGSINLSATPLRPWALSC
jgi:hypothetical protein